MACCSIACALSSLIWVSLHVPRVNVLTTEDMKAVLNQESTLNKVLLVSSDKSLKPKFPSFKLLLTAKRQAHSGQWPLLG